MLPDPTPRLRVREMTTADQPDISTLELGGSARPRGLDRVEPPQLPEHGFGLWVVETHEGEFVGDCGLTFQEVEGEWLIEAGWHVREKLRRQGYAAEAAASVRAAAEAAGVEHLIAHHPAPQRGVERVAASIGLVLEREVDNAPAAARPVLSERSIASCRPPLAAAPPWWTWT